MKEGEIVKCKTLNRQLRNPPGLLLALAFLIFPATAHAQLYDHTAKTDFDIITTADPSAFLCLEYYGLGRKEMPDLKRRNSLFKSDVFVFTAYYSDGTSIEVVVNPEFKNVDAARTEALRYTNRLGQLPTILRKGVSRMIVHGTGYSGFVGGDGAMILYSDYATKKIAHNHLEESLFHESIHAAFQKEQSGPGWAAAQEADGAFLTRYGKDKPASEDLAETALFAYSILHHPGRIPVADEEKIKATIPNRIEYVRNLLPPDQPIFFSVKEAYQCDGSAKVSLSNPSLPDDSGQLPTDNRTSSDPDSPVYQWFDSDIMSNVLLHIYDRDEDKVSSFLMSWKNIDYTGPELIKATATEFGLDKAALKTEIEKWRGSDF